MCKLYERFLKWLCRSSANWNMENEACDQATVCVGYTKGELDERQYSKTNAECKKTLDGLRYSKSAVDERVRIRSVFSEAMTRIGHRVFGNEIDKILVGSKREGISLFGESDTDVMFVLKSLKAVEDPKAGDHQGCQVFAMDTEGIQVGYTLLRLTEGTVVNDYIADDLLEEYKSAQYLSSDKIMTDKPDTYKFRRTRRRMRYWPYDNVALLQTERRGPSKPQRFRYDDEYTLLYDNMIGNRSDLMKNDIDKVQAIPCECPTILQAWVNRPRPKNWPTMEMIKTFSQQPVHVVPVGRSGSVREDLQWRISFTLGEIYLIQTFDDTQIKMLVLMRIIAKNILKPISNKFSSYLIKNVVLWLLEDGSRGSSLATPQCTKFAKRAVRGVQNVERFQADFLLFLIQDGLQYLLESVQKKHLPCYTIPERNLLHSLGEDDASQAEGALKDFLADYHRNVIKIVEDIGNCSSKLNDLSRRDAVICTNLYSDITADDLEEHSFENCYECRYANAPLCRTSL